MITVILKDADSPAAALAANVDDMAILEECIRVAIQTAIELERDHAAQENAEAVADNRTLAPLPFVMPEVKIDRRKGPWTEERKAKAAERKRAWWAGRKTAA